MKSGSKQDGILFVAVVAMLLAFGSSVTADGVSQQNWWWAALGVLLAWSGIYVGLAGRGMWPRRTLRVVTAGLVVVGITEFVESGWQIQNLLEHALLMGAPMALAMRWSEQGRAASVQLALFLTAATFLGHGVYALGVGREDTNFIEMTTTLLGVGADGADIFLKVVGGLDILAAILLMVGRGFKIALWYMVGWGLVTAVARVVYLTGADSNWAGVTLAVAAMAYRLVHGLAPLWILRVGKWGEETD